MSQYLLPFTFEHHFPPHCQQYIRPYIWDAHERIRFAVFLDFYREDYKTLVQKRQQQWSFWRKVSIFVQTKNANQCRIYHKKLLKQFKEPDLIINSFKANIRQFKHWKSYYQEALINVSNCLIKQLSASRQHQHYDMKTDKTCISHSQLPPLSKKPSMCQERDGGKGAKIDYAPVKCKSMITSKISYHDGYKPKRNNEYKQNMVQTEQILPKEQETKQKPVSQNIPMEAEAFSLAEWTLCHQTFLKYVEEINNLFGSVSEDFL